MFYYFLTFIFVNKHRLPYRKERYINALGVMHNAVILPERATRCRYRPRAWVWLRLAWPGSAAQGKPRRRQARQAVALRRPGKTRKVSPGFEKYCTSCEFIMNDCITTTKQSTTKPCAYFLGYTVHSDELWTGSISPISTRSIQDYYPSIHEIVEVIAYIMGHNSQTTKK